MWHRFSVHAALLALLLLLPLRALAAELLLNEYNGVDGAGWLNGGSEAIDGGGGVAEDARLGRVLANGGDWFELVVIADHLDIRGWALDICEGGACGTQLVFSQDPLWSDLRAGTLITVAEAQPEDVSYDPTPEGDDWWINVRAAFDGTGAYISATDFPVSNDDWELTIRDAADALIFGPAGEQYAGVGVNSREVFKLESAPSAITRPDDREYDDGIHSSFGLPNVYAGGAARQDFSALRLGQPRPDQDADGVPDDGDFSGRVSDAGCVDGETAGCDDNCGMRPNPSQLDVDGVGGGGPDGIGDACQCGDVTDDGGVTQADLDALRAALLGDDSGIAAPEKCAIYGPGCDILDAVVMARALALPESGPGIAQVCEAATVAPDQTDQMFAQGRVLEIDITMAPADLDAIRLQQHDLFEHLGPGCFDGPPPSPYSFHPADVTVDGHLLTNVGVRKKGQFGSSDFVKPALKIDFGEFNAGQELYGVDRLTLNNAKQDVSLVKQCLGYQIFDRAGVPAPRCSFANVTINGTPMGIYVNVEGIKEPFLERHFGDASGNLYEGNGSDFLESWVDRFEKKTNSQDPSRADLDALVAALALPEEELFEALDPLLDIDDFLTFWAAEALIAHWDGYHSSRNNYYVYFDPSDGKARFIPWGIDLVLAGGNPELGQDVYPVAFPVSHLAQRLYASTPSRNLYLSRVQQLLMGQWDETALVAEIDRIEALLLPYRPDLPDEVQLVRDFVNARRQQVASELEFGPPPWDPAIPPADCGEAIGTVSATFDTTWESLGLGIGGGTFDVQISDFAFDFKSVFSEAGDVNFTGTGLTSEIRIVGTVGGEDLPVVGLLIPVHHELIQPLTLDLSGTFVTLLVDYPDQSNPPQPIGVMVGASITFTEASTTAGAPIRGSFSGIILGYPDDEPNE